VMSKQPAVGKVKQGITFFWEELWEIHWDHKPYQRNSRELLKQVERCPEMVFNNLHYLIDTDFLFEAFNCTRKDLSIRGGQAYGKGVCRKS